MSIKADFHMHSSYSFDSSESIEEMLKSSINKGLNKICFTEHMDVDYPVNDDNPEHAWECNADAFIYDVLKTREKYDKEIETHFGLEIGMQEESFGKNALIVRSHEYDFIIGSVHLVNKMDPYYPVFFNGISDKDAVTLYLNTVLKNIRKFQNFDVLGHIDYIVRTLPGGEDIYKPNDYMDIIDEILSFIIENEKGIELNTAQLVKGYNNPNPHPLIIKRYKELGGEIITVGSDAHKKENVGVFFDKAEEILLDAGFKYYCSYSDRIANFHKLI